MHSLHARHFPHNIHHHGTSSSAAVQRRAVPACIGSRYIGKRCPPPEASGCAGGRRDPFPHQKACDTGCSAVAQSTPSTPQPSNEIGPLPTMRRGPIIATQRVANHEEGTRHRHAKSMHLVCTTCQDTTPREEQGQGGYRSMGSLLRG